MLRNICELVRKKSEKLLPLRKEYVRKFKNMKSTKNPIMDPKKFTESLDTLMNYFENDEKCIEYIFQIKYKNGWRCPKSKCGSKKYYLIKKRNIIRCSKCKHEKSFMADTIFGYTKLPLRQWFKVIYIFATQKKHTSAAELHKQLGLGSYKTVLYLLHKIRMALGELEKPKLSGDIEYGDFYLTTWDWYENALIACAVEMKYDKKGQPALGKIKLEHVPSDDRVYFQNFIKKNIKVGSSVTTSTHKNYRGIRNLGYTHKTIIISSGREGEIRFPRVYKIYSDLEQWLRRTYINVSSDFLQNYLNEYTFGFNRKGNKAKAFTDVMEFAILGKDRNK
ncbi:hypothetical protein ES703_30162 [subsurface metagenome]